MKIFFNILIIDIFINSISAAHNNIIHFIKYGSADSILIESNGKFGLIDSSNSYRYIEQEVESVQIDKSERRNKSMVFKCRWKGPISIKLFRIFKS